MKLREKTIGVSPVGCAVIAYYYWDFDVCEAPHGRPPAVAAGIKSVRPDCLVFTYQGDGDLAAIGFNETIHAANRGDNITIIFINNAVYGMTGGQLAPTTLCGQITATTPSGRDSRRYGQPFHVAEMLAQLPGVSYSTRVALYDVPSILKTKQAIKKAFEVLKMEDYAKLDIRLDQSGRYYFIDPNANPAFGPKESFCALGTIMDLYGIDFNEILKRLAINTLNGSLTNQPNDGSEQPV